MNKYHVTYWYLASGQEGVPYTHDYGIVEARDSENAKIKAVENKLERLRKDFPEFTEDRIIGIAIDGLSAELIK